MCLIQRLTDYNEKYKQWIECSDKFNKTQIYNDIACLN